MFGAVSRSTAAAAAAAAAGAAHVDSTGSMGAAAAARGLCARPIDGRDIGRRSRRVAIGAETSEGEVLGNEISADDSRCAILTSSVVVPQMFALKLPLMITRPRRRTWHVYLSVQYLRYRSIGCTAREAAGSGQCWAPRLPPATTLYRDR